MGLDGVAIVMEVEDRFGMEFPWDAIPGMVTVGDMFEHVVAALKLPSTESKCLSALAFLSLRRGAVRLGARERLRPHDGVDTFLPRAGRIEYWSRLQAESGLSLPPLALPGWLVLVCIMLVLICVMIAGFVAYGSSQSSLTGWTAAVAAGFVSAMIAVESTRPFATAVPFECVTLRKLSHAALRLNFEKLSERGGGRGRDDVWLALREIIANQLGISPDKVVPTARFVKDLGVG